MPAVEKNTSKHGLLVAAETTSYGSGTPSLSTSTDGVQVFEAPVVAVNYLHDGTREGRSSGGYGAIPRVAPSGRWGELQAKHYWRGVSDGTYSSSAESSTVHHLVRGLGMAGTFATDKWTYNFASSSYVSLVMEAYYHGMKANLSGAYCTGLEIAGDTRSVPAWTFDARGILSALQSDSTVPAITYNTAGGQPKNAGLTATLTNAATSVSLRLRRYSVKIAREISEREDLTSTGHPGWELAAPSVQIDLTVEATTAVGSSPYVANATRRYDPFPLFDAGEKVQLVLGIGSVSGSRFSLGSAAETMQFTAAPVHGNEGAIATLDLSLAAYPADDASELDFYILTD